MEPKSCGISLFFFKVFGTNSNREKTQTVTKPKLWQNSDCEEEKNYFNEKYNCKETKIVTTQMATRGCS